METGVEHPLRAWRLSKGFKLDYCAAEIGTVRQVWYDWESARRIPQRDSMVAIYRFTRGEVSPNDFYDLPALDQLNLPIDEPSPVPLLEEAA